MKIIIIGTAHPFRGGLASYNERMANELMTEGHDVEIYTFTVQYPSFLFPGKTQFSEEPEPNDLVIYQKINSINPLNWLKIGKEIRQKKPDLILIKYWLPFMGPCFGRILKSVKKNKKTKVISLLDNIIPHEKRFGDVAFTNYFVKQVDGFVYMSESVGKDLNQFSTNKPSVFNPHPLFDNFGKSVSRKEAANYLGLNEHEKYILFFGIIRDYKGLDWLLEAFAKSHLKNEIKLLVVGEYYSNKDKYQKLIDQLGLQECVIVHDQFVKDSDIKYWFSLANLLVQPYKDATQSGVTQIAYQFDLPMIVTNVGGLPEMIPNEKVGLVVAPEIDNIQKAMEYYFDQDKEASFRANFSEEKPKYAWSRLNEQIYSLYEQIN